MKEKFAGSIDGRIACLGGKRWSIDGTIVCWLSVVSLVIPSLFPSSSCPLVSRRWHPIARSWFEGKEGWRRREKTLSRKREREKERKSRSSAAFACSGQSTFARCKNSRVEQASSIKHPTEAASHQQAVRNSILHPVWRVRASLTNKSFHLELYSLFLFASSLLLLFQPRTQERIQVEAEQKKEQLQAWLCAVLNPGAFISSLILHPSSFVSVSPCQHSRVTHTTLQLQFYSPALFMAAKYSATLLYYIISFLLCQLFYLHLRWS